MGSHSFPSVWLAKILGLFYLNINGGDVQRKNVVNNVDNINGRDVQTKNVVNNVDMSCLRAP